MPKGTPRTHKGNVKGIHWVIHAIATKCRVYIKGILKTIKRM